MSNHRGAVPDWLNEGYMEDVVRKHWKQPDAVVRQIVVTPGSKVGDNYVGQILRIKLVVDFSGKTEALSIIGKLKPDTKAIKVIDDQLDIFKVEASVFEFLFPSLKDAIKDATAARDFAPECYHVDNENKIILMEDLVAKNYELQKRGRFLSKEQALLTAEALATMHGASYLAVQKEPGLKKMFEKCLWSMKDGVFETMYENSYVSINRNVESFGLSAEQCTKLRELVIKMKKEYATKICDFRANSLNVMSHGDCWINNMMYHYTDGVPDDVILLDFQVTSYNSFAIDLNYFLFTSVEANVIVDNLDTFLETYYNKLKAVAPEIPNLTLEKVKGEFFERLYFGLVITVLVRPFNVQKTPIDFEEVLSGEIDDRGYKHPQYSADLRKLVPFFENAAVL